MRINKILGIAINEYDNSELNKIENCLNDINAICSVLTTKYTFDDVEIISSKEETTRKSLFNILNSYFINSLEDENILLLYAGHGQYNPLLQTAYWQPSDADPNDFSTWLNIGELLGFIKAAKAYHINIISDSCFSGAIFQSNTRGGGVEAFNSKKSRLALTSGGIEKVSDGVSGQLSPFANTLVNLLEENKASELPFNILASNLILNFTNSKAQTPMFGPLNDVGHEGGAFIFKLKPKDSSELIVNEINEYLNSKLFHLHIPITKIDLATIEIIRVLIEKKIKSVKDQNFERAAQYRDEEKVAIKEIIYRIPSQIESFFDNINTSAEELQRIEKLNEDIVSYEKRKPEREAYLKKVEELLANSESQIEIGESTQFPDLAFVDFELLTDRNPELEYFNSSQDKLIVLYQTSIIDFVTYFLRISSNSKSKFLIKKKEDLLQILNKLYSYEINLVTNVRNRNDLESIIQLREIDMSLLNWIKDK